MRLAYLGPVGTYGEQAAKQLAALAGLEATLIPQPGIQAVIRALAEGDCDAAVVPVENSVEGGVTSCLDALWQYPDLVICHGLVLPIRHALLGSGPLDGISEVLSHPQALAQCPQWLANHLPGALQLPTSSTAEAARLVRGSRFRAAIASLDAAREHGLEVIAYPINDVVGNCTRFLLLRREHSTAGSGPLASLAFSLQANRPGALLEALGCFAKEGLNMSRIESRPSKRSMGEYIFFVDVDLMQGMSSLDRAMDTLRPHCEQLILFGAYPLAIINQQEEINVTNN